MSLYYFDVFNGDRIIVDETGTELDSEVAVRDEAIRTLPIVAAEELPDGSERNFWVKVRDETGAYIFGASLDFKSAWMR